jgi:hypothetical protein
MSCVPRIACGVLEGGLLIVRAVSAFGQPAKAARRARAGRPSAAHRIRVAAQYARR